MGRESAVDKYFVCASRQSRWRYDLCLCASAIAVLLGCAVGLSVDAAATENRIDRNERAAVRKAVDASEHVGPWWWDVHGDRWSPAPDASWHGEVSNGDARYRWLDVSSVRHIDVPDRGRWAVVLDRGATSKRQQENMVGGAKLVAMSVLTRGVVDVWWFDTGHEVREASSLDDFLIDRQVATAVIHDAGTASLLLVDLWSRRTHRALAGCVPADAELEIDEAEGWLTWRVPGQPVGWRAPWEELKDFSFDPAALSHLVEPTVDQFVRSGETVSKVLQEDQRLVSVSPRLRPSEMRRVAQRWAKSGLGRGLGLEEAHVVLQREAARGATALLQERIMAQEP